MTRRHLFSLFAALPFVKRWTAKPLLKSGSRIDIKFRPDPNIWRAPFRIVTSGNCQPSVIHFLNDHIWMLRPGEQPVIFTNLQIPAKDNAEMRERECGG